MKHLMLLLQTKYGGGATDAQNHLNIYYSQCYSQAYLNFGGKGLNFCIGFCLLFLACYVHTRYALGDVDGSPFIQATYALKLARVLSSPS